MTILYVIVFILSIHYSWPGIIMWLSAFGMVWSALKSVVNAIIKLAEEQGK